MEANGLLGYEEMSGWKLNRSGAITQRVYDRGVKMYQCRVVIDLRTGPVPKEQIKVISC